MQYFNNIRRIIAVLVIAAATYLTVVIALKVHQVKEPSDILSALPKNIDLSLQKVRYTNTKDGSLQWDLVASKVDYYNEPGVIRFTGPEMIFSGRGAAATYTLKAETADYYKNSGNVKLAGNVTAATGAGMKFTAGNVEYIAKKAMITTNDHVKLTDGNFSVEGSGMEIMVHEKRLTVKRNIHAVVGNWKR
jgi:LPS export ABC transporter protein LptC